LSSIDGKFAIDLTSFPASLPTILPAAGLIELLSLPVSQPTYFLAAGPIEPPSLPARLPADFIFNLLARPICISLSLF